MDEKTAKLRDIFIDATGSDTATESQREGRGSLVDDGDDRRVTERVGELVSRMADRYEFESGLGDADLKRVVFGFYDGADDDDIAAELDADADAETVFRARMDLHLVREEDRDAPFEFDELRPMVLDGAEDGDIAAELDADADEETVAHYRRVVEATAEATRANHRYRDQFEELLTDAELSSRLDLDAHHDELREATEDIETNVSF